MCVVFLTFLSQKYNIGAFLTVHRNVTFAALLFSLSGCVGSDVRYTLVTE